MKSHLPTQHILPIDDLKEHFEPTGINNYGEVFCPCLCKPKIMDDGYGGIIVVHNSFDGREGVEWANEILNNNQTP